MLLNVVILISDAEPVANTVTTLAYSYRVWLARLTCLSDKSKRSQVVKISALKTMSKMVQKTLKQRSTQRKCHHKSSEKTKPEQPCICCCPNLLKTPTMVVSSFTRCKPLGLLQVCINKQTIQLETECNSWITTSE